MGSLLNILVAVEMLLLVIVFVLASMVASLSRDVSTLARMCGECTEARIRQFKKDNP